MSQDAYLKVVLTVIAAALCFTAIALIETAPSASAAEPPGSIGVGEGTGEPDREPSGLAPPSPTSTLPLRWRIPYGRHLDNSAGGTLDCGTAVSVVGFGPSTIQVEVEFFGFSGASEGKTSLSLLPGSPDVHATDTGISFSPFGVNALANTGTFEGFALVFADDPRIFVGAYLVCSEVNLSVNGFPRSLTNLSAYPVGRTLDFFQASVPGTAPMPPVAGRES